MKGFIFNGYHSNEFDMIVNKVARSIAPPLTDKSVKVGNRDGEYWFGNDMGVRTFTVTATLHTASSTELINRARAIGNWLISDEEQELIFDEEPDKSYFAYLVGDTPIDQLDKISTDKIATLTLNFQCPDPYAYGSEIESNEITSSPATVDIGGQIDTNPVVLAKFTDESPYFSFAIKDKYVHLGANIDPDTGDVPVKAQERLLWDQMDSLDLWQPNNGATYIDNGTSTGSFMTTGDAFHVSSYGTGSTWHGPSLKRMLSQELTDYLVQIRCGMFASKQEQFGKIEIYLLDANGKNIGKLELKDNSGYEETHFIARAGVISTGNYHNIIDTVGKITYQKTTKTVKKKVNGKWKNVKETVTTGAYSEFRDFYGYITLQKKDNKWEANFIRIAKDTLSEISRKTWKWTDTKNLYSDKLAGLAVYISQYGTKPIESTMYVSDVKIYKLNDTDPDAIPMIVEAGDEIMIDCESAVVYKNNRRFMEPLAIGSEFFSLPAGETTQFSYSPADKCTVYLTHRPRFR